MENPFIELRLYPHKNDYRRGSSECLTDLEGAEDPHNTSSTLLTVHEYAACVKWTHSRSMSMQREV